MKTTKIFFVLFLSVLMLLPTFPVLADSGSLAVDRMLSPNTIFLAGSGYTPETSTVTLSVGGYGGSITHTLPIDVVFSIDSSGSMYSTDPGNLRITAANNFVDKLDPSRDTAGVVSCDTEKLLQYGLTNDFASLHTQINSIGYNGNTNLTLGLQAAVDMLDTTGQADSVKVIIFLTDGQQTVGTYNNYYAEQAASKGYKIYSIGLSSNAYAPPLMQMALTTGGQYFSSPTSQNLQTIFDEILTTVVLNTSPSMVNITETTMSYIVEESDFSITPDSVTEVDGQTVITWLNVARYIGNYDNQLAADEIFVVSYTIKCSQYGVNLPVAVDGQSIVDYLNEEGDVVSTLIPQAYITVYQPIWINIEPESVNLKSKGLLTVFVYSTDGFDATTIDLNTVSFEGAQPVWSNVNGQGTLMLKFERQDLTWTAGTTYGTFTALIINGQPVVGSDDVRVF